MTNKSVWLSAFTHGVVASAGPGEGEDRCYRRGRRTDPAAHLPQSHVETLLSLPADLKLDVAVLLAVRASMREAVPQQVNSPVGPTGNRRRPQARSTAAEGSLVCCPGSLGQKALEGLAMNAAE